MHVNRSEIHAKTAKRSRAFNLGYIKSCEIKSDSPEMAAMMLMLINFNNGESVLKTTPFFTPFSQFSYVYGYFTPETVYKYLSIKEQYNSKFLVSQQYAKACSDLLLHMLLLKL